MPLSAHAALVKPSLSARDARTGSSDEHERCVARRREIRVDEKGTATRFDFAEVASEAASRTKPNGTRSFITILPGMEGLELVVGERDGKRTLTTRDGQHEYLFVEAG